MDHKSLFSQLKILFPGLAPQDLRAEIIEKGKWMALPPGQQVIDVGNVIRIVPLVFSGSIKVIREDDAGNELFLYYIRSGESCAMTLSSCLRQEKSAIKAVVESSASVLALPVDVVRDLNRRFPLWNDFITETYARRFEEILEVVDQIAFQQLDVRLLKYLLDKSQLLQSRILTISRTEIARDLHSSREVISRLLKQMERRKLLHIRGNQIEIS